MADPPLTAAPANASSVPLVVTGVAALLALIALVQPLWAIQTDTGGGTIDKEIFTWTSRIDEEWRNGALATTTITPYSSPGFSQFRMRDAASTTYLIGAAYAALVVLLGGLQFGFHRGRISRAAVRAAHILAVVVGIAPLAYAVNAIPPAARLDIDPAISGFWGRTGVSAEVLSWGPGLAWWLWAASVGLVLLGLAAPLLRRAQTRPASTQ